MMQFFGVVVEVTDIANDSVVSPGGSDYSRALGRKVIDNECEPYLAVLDLCFAIME